MQSRVDVRSENNTPSLYDAHGNVIKTEVPIKPSDPKRAWTLPAWAKGWKLVVEVCAVVGLLLTLYAIRPVLSVTSSTGTGIDGTYGVKASITDTGLSSIRDVSVQCVTNKVIFENKFTLEFDKFVSVDEYSVGDLRAGESLTTNCTFAWSMWEKSGQQGLLILGHGTPGKPNLGIAFKYADGIPIATSQCPSSITVGFDDAIRYQNRKLTAVDGSFIVRYKWRLWPWRQKRIIHMIESPGPEDGIRWRVAPASEPVIRDAPADKNGWKMTAKSNSAKFALTMKGGYYPSE